MINIFLFIILLFLSFLFSGTETAYFSLSNLELKNIIKKKKHSKSILNKIYHNRTKFLISLLFLNTFVNVFFIFVFNTIFRGISDNILINVIIVTFILLIFGEITPKIIASYRQHIFVNVIPITFFFHTIVSPLSSVIGFVLKRITTEKKDDIDYNELVDMLDYIKKHYKDIVNEVDLIQRYMSLREMNVEDICVTAEEIVCLKKDMTFMEVSKVFSLKRFSRMPVINRNLNEIIGIVYFKDMIFVDRSATVKGIIRDINFISNDTSVFKLLSWFLKTKIHIVIIQDISGKITGLVTLNDIVERLLGQLPDEKGII